MFFWWWGWKNLPFFQPSCLPNIDQLQWPASWINGKKVFHLSFSTIKAPGRKLDSKETSFVMVWFGVGPEKRQVFTWFYRTFERGRYEGNLKDIYQVNWTKMQSNHFSQRHVWLETKGIARDTHTHNPCTRLKISTNPGWSGTHKLKRCCGKICIVEQHVLRLYVKNNRKSRSKKIYSKMRGGIQSVLKWVFVWPKNKKSRAKDWFRGHGIKNLACFSRYEDSVKWRLINDSY